jgi:hypothetical protein
MVVGPDNKSKPETQLPTMQKLLAVYVVATVILCGLAFEGLSRLTGSSTAAKEAPVVEADISSRIAECVLSVLRDQEIAREADRERFIQANSGVPARVVLEAMRLRGPPPTVAEVEYARNQQLIRITELCRLRISAARQ